MVNLQLKVGDFCESSTEDFGALPIEQINPDFGIFVNPELRIYHRKINPQLYWESLQVIYVIEVIDFKSEVRFGLRGCFEVVVASDAVMLLQWQT